MSSNTLHGWASPAAGLLEATARLLDSAALWLRRQAQQWAAKSPSGPGVGEWAGSGTADWRPGNGQLVITGGRVWVTVQGSFADHVLEAGDTLSTQRGMRLWISAWCAGETTSWQWLPARPWAPRSASLPVAQPRRPDTAQHIRSHRSTTA